MNAPELEPPTALPIEAAFQFCPRCGTPNESPGSVPFHCASCQHANFFGPCAAVGGLVVNDKNQILLVRRARDPGKGRWGLPGGFIDRDESVEEALAREIMEETRLTLTKCELLVTGPNQYNYRGIVAPVIDLFYVCKVADYQQIKLAPDELDHFEWVRPRTEHLENMAFVSNRHAIEYWLETSK